MNGWAELAVHGPEDVRRARELAAELTGWAPDVRSDVELVLTELATNGYLHGEPPVTVRLRAEPDRVRVEVADRGRAVPVPHHGTVEGMTGRGFGLVTALSSAWGVDGLPEGGKVVWAELARDDVGGPAEPELGVEALLAAWPEEEAEPRLTVRLGPVPTALLIDAKAHIDDVVRELTLAQANGEREASLGRATGALISAATQEFAEGRAEVKRQAQEAVARGDLLTDLTLRLPASAAAAAERYLDALEETDRQARAARMLTLAAPRSHAVFRRWYLGNLAQQLRALAVGDEVAAPTPFAEVLAAEVDVLDTLTEAQSRLELLQTIAAGLLKAESMPEMAAVVTGAAAAHPGVDNAIVYARTDQDTIRLLSWAGDDPAEPQFDELPLDADLPGPLVVRTGTALHLRSLAALVEQFPSLGVAPVGAPERSLHFVPLLVAGRSVGLLVLTFRGGETTDTAQLSFVHAIADSLAQSVERTAAVRRSEAERRRDLALVAAQLDVLPAVLAGLPVEEGLDRLLAQVSQAGDPLAAAVLLLTPDGQALRPVARCGLPPGYADAASRIEISPGGGSCAAAAYSRRQVIVTDVATDPHWEHARVFALEAGIRATWSTPILTDDGRLLGTFALYFLRPLEPSAGDRAFMDLMARTAALILEPARTAVPADRDHTARYALELAVRAGGIATFDWDLRKDELVWDPRLLEIFGQPSEGVPRVLPIEVFYALVHPADRERVMRLNQRAIDECGEYDAEYRVLLPDGRERWIAARGRVVAGPDGRAERFLGAAQDTTERREGEARVARVMDSMATAFFFLDGDWRFSFLNAEAERVLARRRDELLGRSMWEEFPAAVGSPFDTHYRHALETGEPVAFDAFTRSR